MTSTIEPRRTAAKRFFWGWLIGSAAVSILGNVTHAVLGDAPSPAIASVTAFFIVVIQLCATYGAHALVQARIVGAAYRVALCIAVALAVGAFVLMWVALRDLVITWAGYPPITAWIVPLIVDLGITGSTIALLALTNAERAEQLHMHAAAQPTHASAAVHVEVHNTVRADAHPEQPAEIPARHDAYEAAAVRIVTQGAVRIGAERVAQVLAAHANGATRSEIASALGVHHSTVRRIIEHDNAGSAAA
ncbi:helix-turn-helix domain-containing protein [Mycolicibacterium mageritense]|uniref:helix-turn-helix domain-containing protein n=1 Tax=Mycolicibacterium mageritense TaxID=53462 RepID=UPI001E5D3B5C|nr:helix-turn-helix domain-containing protein [Mycolicibacterium mageritense]MCC9182591.1 helix-turn-helix domain-containing protein [Mycolicibacterium mageritense]